VPPLLLRTYLPCEPCRYYCSDHKLPTLMEVAMTAFRRVVYDSIRHDVGDALVALLNAERCGEAVDGIVIKQAKDICTQIADGSTELWVTDVETAMVLATPHFYAERAMEWLATMSVPEYLHHVDAVLAAEMARAHAYLLPESATPLRQAAEMGLLERVQDRVRCAALSCRMLSMPLRGVVRIISRRDAP